MSNVVTMPWEILDRMERAVATVRERLLRSTAALDRAGIAYAVVGGHAVASWVATADEGAVRNAPDVELLVRRDDLTAISEALKNVGFVAEQSLGRTVFLDGADGKPRESVRLHFEAEKGKNSDPFTAPAIETVSDQELLKVLILESLVRMQLTAGRNENYMLLHDMIGVGLIDQTWLAKLPSILAERLKAILDTPEG